MASSSSEATGGGGRRTWNPCNSEAKSSGDTDWAASRLADGRSEAVLIEIHTYLSSTYLSSDIAAKSEVFQLKENEK